MSAISAQDIAPVTNARGPISGRLFRKYVTLFVGVVCVGVTANSVSDAWISYREQRQFFIREQRDHAVAASAQIVQYIGEIGRQIGWTTQLPWDPAELDDRHIDAVRLLHQMPSISELTQVDRSGREQLRASQLAQDVLRGGMDYSEDKRFKEALAKKVYYGPVYFLHDSEPHMSIAMAGERSDSLVSIADVNLKFVFDLISQIRVGSHGKAYLVDADDRLIAHPDMSLVLRKTDLSGLPQVQAARINLDEGLPRQVIAANDLQGQSVLTAYAVIYPLQWLVFVELPVNEVYASVYASLGRFVLLLLAALGLAVIASIALAHRMIVPIQELRRSAALIGAGALDRRISIRTGDELEELGEAFNSMAGRLRESYATLERKVEERTRALELANEAKSRFLAAASHDLRQPLHALGLFVAQLQTDMAIADQNRIFERIRAALAGINELFGALLDISKLDAGVFDPDITEFPVAGVLQRMESTFSGVAGEKGLSFRVVPSAAWIRSDFILLERVILNLVSNAIQNTCRGGVVVGCRQRGEALIIEVWDTGPGIPPDQRKKIFGEFYRLADSSLVRNAGLGLGLAIVERLCRLLGHPIDLASTLGRGSRFAVTVPRVAPRRDLALAPISPPTIDDAFSEKLVVVIDDDSLVLESSSGLLRQWKCEVVIGDCYSTARARIKTQGRPPDCIISDYHLADAISGIAAIEALRREFGRTIPAFLISGDISAESLRHARENGYHLLHKPVTPIAIRSLLNNLSKDSACSVNYEGAWPAGPGPAR